MTLKRRNPGTPPQVIDQLSGKQAIGLLFSGLMLVSDFVEEFEKGRDVVTAGKRAKKKAARRTAALARAELEEVEDDDQEASGVVVDVKKAHGSGKGK